jgi:drug/metabolite transporter (DMT)-like permease
MNTQDNQKSIIYILLGMSLFSIQDGLIKFVYNDTSLYELYFGRTFVAFVLLLIFMWFKKEKLILKTHYPFLTIFRVILFFFGFSFFYISLTFMSLAMANALFFSSPFFISIFAKLFLKENIGIKRWSAIFVGFIGVYIVLNPDFENFKFVNLAPVACALCYSASMIILKVTSDKDNVYTQLSHLYIGAIIISILFYIFAGDGKFNSFTNPSMQFIFRKWFVNPKEAWPIIFFMGCCGALAFAFVFNAYNKGSPSTVSLFEYSLILYSIIIGYLIFDESPTTRTLIGASIIVLSGIYIYFREKVKNNLIVTENPIR